MFQHFQATMRYEFPGCQLTYCDFCQGPLVKGVADMLIIYICSLMSIDGEISDRKDSMDSPFSLCV